MDSIDKKSVFSLPMKILSPRQRGSTILLVIISAVAFMGLMYGTVSLNTSTTQKYRANRAQLAALNSLEATTLGAVRSAYLNGKVAVAAVTAASPTPTCGAYATKVTIPVVSGGTITMCFQPEPNYNGPATTAPETGACTNLNNKQVCFKALNEKLPSAEDWLLGESQMQVATVEEAGNAPNGRFAFFTPLKLLADSSVGSHMQDPVFTATTYTIPTGPPVYGGYSVTCGAATGFDCLEVSTCVKPSGICNPNEYVRQKIAFPSSAMQIVTTGAANQYTGLNCYLTLLSISQSISAGTGVNSVSGTLCTASATTTTLLVSWKEPDGTFANRISYYSCECGTATTTTTIPPVTVSSTTSTVASGSATIIPSRGTPVDNLAY